MQVITWTNRQSSLGGRSFMFNHLQSKMKSHTIFPGKWEQEGKHAIPFIFEVKEKGESHRSCKMQQAWLQANSLVNSKLFNIKKERKEEIILIYIIPHHG